MIEAISAGITASITDRSVIEISPFLCYIITDRSVINVCCTYGLTKEGKEMPEKIKSLQPPHGFSRMMYRLPVWLFHVHLGWLLGNRFLLLTHTGRKSGLPR